MPTATIRSPGAAPRPSPGGNAPSYPTSTVSFTNGVSTTTLSATLFAAGSNSLTATATSPSLAGTATIDVSAAAAHHFKVTAPAIATAGTAFNTVTLTAQDLYNNTATGYANGNHAITWSGASTSPGGNAPSYPTSTVSFTNGVGATTLSATLFAAGSNSLTATATSPSLAGTATIDVSAAAAHHFKVTAPAIATAGTAFNTVTLTAQDLYNNTATGYANGNHAITWSGASTSPGRKSPQLSDQHRLVHQRGQHHDAVGDPVRGWLEQPHGNRDLAQPGRHGHDQCQLGRCGAFLQPHMSGGGPKNSSTAFTILVPNDAYGNAFRSSSGIAIGSR